jgi:hypothetical protein
MQRLGFSYEAVRTRRPTPVTVFRRRWACRYSRTGRANFDSHRNNFSLDSAALWPLDFPRPNGYIWR